jgi:hypothetical protein
MNKTMKRKEESGQILLILTVGIVALVGFMALAIDGGMIYADRRYDQNAADASAFAGGGTLAMNLENQQIYHTNFACSNTNVTDAITVAKAAAVNRAASNNFSIDLDVNNQHGVEIFCHDSGGPFDPRFLDVYTMVSSEIQTSFAHFFYKGPVRNVVESSVRVNLGGDAGYGYALATLSEDCDENLEFKGGGGSKSTIYLVGSGAHSNACVYRNGNVDVISTGPVSHADEQIANSQGYISKGGAGAIVPTPNRLNEIIPRPNFDIIAEQCGPSQGSFDNPGLKTKVELDPGTYSTISIKNQNHVELKPGLYCLDGSFSMNAGTLEGYGVTIVMLNAGLNITGGEITLIAPSDVTLSYRNLLVYAMTTNTSVHSIRGNGNSEFVGSILIPNGSVSLGGTSGSGTASGDPSYTTQIVANNITVHGTATLNLTYDESLVWRQPSLVSLLQ